MFKNLAKSIAIYGIATGISKSSMLILVPIFTRVFTPEEYGLIDLIFTFTSFVAIFGMLQLQSAVSRYYYEVKDATERKRYVSTAFWTIIGISIVLEIGVIVLADLITEYFDSSQYKDVLIVASLIIPTSNLFAFLTVIMRFEKKPFTYTFIMLLQVVFTVALSAWLLIDQKVGIIGVFYGQIAGFIISSLTLIYYLRHLITIYYSKKVINRFFVYSLPLLPAVAINWGNSYVSRFIMLSFLSLTEIGLYTVALKIAAVIKLFEQAFKLAWGPMKWEYLTKSDHKIVYQGVMKYVTVLVLGMVSVFALFSKEVMSIMATEAYMDAHTLISILAYSFGLTIIYNVVGMGPSIRKKTIYNTIIYFISLLVNVIALFVLVPRIGLIGVPISLLISSITLIVVGWLNSEKMYHIGFDKLFFTKIFIITLGLTLLPLWIDIHVIIKILLVIVIIISAKLLVFREVKISDIFK